MKEIKPGLHHVIEVRIKPQALKALRKLSEKEAQVLARRIADDFRLANNLIKHGESLLHAVEQICNVLEDDPESWKFTLDDKHTALYCAFSYAKGVPEE